MSGLQELLEGDPERCVVRRERCPVCGEEDSRTVVEASYDSPGMQKVREHPDLAARRYLEPLMRVFPYLVLECRRCQLIWQSFALSPEAESRLYALERISFQPGKRTSKWGRPADKFSYYLKSLRRAALAFELSPARAPEEIRVLDFGAGWGEFLQAARAFGYRCTAAELNADKRAHLELHGFDCVSLPAPERFDFIHSDQVFEHLADPLVHLRLLSEHATPSGHLLISVPALSRQCREHSLPTLDPRAVLKVFPFFHLNFYSPRSFAELGFRAGLEPLSMPGSLRNLLPGLGRFKFVPTVKRALAAALPRSRRLNSGVQLFRRRAG